MTINRDDETPEGFDRRVARAELIAALERTPARRYDSPQLVVYGRLHELTRTVGNDDLDVAFAGTAVTT